MIALRTRLCCKGFGVLIFRPRPRRTRRDFAMLRLPGFEGRAPFHAIDAPYIRRRCTLRYRRVSGGIMNAVAGDGTFLTFPALVLDRKSVV